MGPLLPAALPCAPWLPVFQLSSGILLIKNGKKKTKKHSATETPHCVIPIGQQKAGRSFAGEMYTSV